MEFTVSRPSSLLELLGLMNEKVEVVLGSDAAQQLSLAVK